MKMLMSGLVNYLITPRKFSPGISFFGIKFYIALGCYVASFLLLANDPFFHEYGVFSYKQGVIPVVLGFIVLAALNWEFLLFGKPTGANLLLQAAQVLPFSLLCARLLAKPSQPWVPKTMLESVKGFIGDTIAFAFIWLPEWLRDLFANWQASLLTAAVLLVFCIRNVKAKVGLLILILIYLVASNAANSFSVFFALGIVALGVGWALQFCRYGKVMFYENTVNRLRSIPECDETFLRCAGRIMNRLYDGERANEETVLYIVKAEYSAMGRFSELEFKAIANEVTKKMLYEYDLVRIKSDADGLFLYANPSLGVYDGMLSQISTIPRAVMVTLIALLWVILPIDLVPDAIPIFGVIDDVIISLISAVSIRNVIGG